MTEPRKKAKNALEQIERVFQQNKKLREQFDAFLHARRDEDAHEIARKLIHTYDVLRKHERLLLNLEMREGLSEFEQAQKHQLYDLDLLERAIKFLAKKPDAERSVDKEVEESERDFLYSAREELKKLR